MTGQPSAGPCSSNAISRVSVRIVFMFTSAPYVGQAERNAVQVELHGRGLVSRRNANVADQKGHPVFFALKLRFDSGLVYDRPYFLDQAISKFIEYVFGEGLLASRSHGGRTVRHSSLSRLRTGGLSRPIRSAELVRLVGEDPDKPSKFPAALKTATGGGNKSASQALLFLGGKSQPSPSTRTSIVKTATSAEASRSSSNGARSEATASRFETAKSAVP